MLAAAPDFIEIARPSRPTKTPGFINAERLSRKGSKRKVHCVTLGRQFVTAHNFRTRLIINVDGGA